MGSSLIHTVGHKLKIVSSFFSVEMCGKKDSGSEVTQWEGAKVIKFHLIEVLNKLYFAPFFLIVVTYTSPNLPS